MLTHIAEWMESEQYIYGYGDRKKYRCYIFDKHTESYKLFYSEDDFYSELKILSLKYNMTEAEDLICYKRRKNNKSGQ